ncbi:hypothetical protein F5Y16DRAFT_420449 [Xylariaceae sp. FL0255]|nr:hypothetical protein F5Y16DRAFT_420449 [Xylariaceae sp. FL0255]
MLLASIILPFLFQFAQGCISDDDCNLNGLCSQNQTCICDAGWRGYDCGALDLYPATRWTGYNETNATGPNFYKQGAGNSSWGGQIIQDPLDKTLFHLIVAQMLNGCGLSGWKPFSTVIRAESRTGPTGPYNYAQMLFGTYHHNPTTFYSPADKRYVLYCIGKDIDPPTTCGSQSFPDAVSVSSSRDLMNWEPLTELLGNETNPTPWPLSTPENPTHDMLLAVTEDANYTVNIYAAQNFNGPFSLLAGTDSVPIEDPFMWQDKRGNWHMLVHWLIDITLRLKGPRVGAHLYARNWKGPWTFNNATLAFNTTVDFTDGTSILYYRRERPKLYFSDDGEMTPIYLINGVQEFNTSASYTLIQPIGVGAREYEKKLGF